MIRKIIIYQKGSTKPIILTETSEQPLEELQAELLDALKTDKISIINTTTDSLIIRPSEIQAMLITNNDNQQEASKKESLTKKLSLENPND